MAETAGSNSAWQWQVINKRQDPLVTVRDVHAGHQETSFTRKVEQHWDRLHRESW